MKILKGILIFIAVVALLLVIITFFLPSKVEMERSKVIDAPQEVLFDQVNNLKNWTGWSPWDRLDPNMETTYSSDNPEGEGAWYEWSGNSQVGSGKLTIIESEPHKRLRTEMLFDGQDGAAYSNWIFESVDGGTNVTWTFDSEMSGIGKWFGLVLESLLSPQYEEGLSNLDSLAANLPKEPVADVQAFTHPDTWYVGYMIETTQEDVANPAHYARGLNAVYSYLMAQGIEPAGQPRCIYHKWEPESVVMEMAIAVSDSVGVPDSLTVNHIPSGPALKMQHMGSYDELDQAWGAFEKYNQANNVEPRWSPYELYVTDPGQEPDTSKWVTEIVYPVN